MQLAIIGSKEEILEVIKFVKNMQIVTQNERLIRTEFKSRIEEKDIQFEQSTTSNSVNRPF